MCPCWRTLNANCLARRWQCKISTKALPFPRKIRRTNYGIKQARQIERHVKFTFISPWPCPRLCMRMYVTVTIFFFLIKSLTLHSDTEQQCCLRTLHNLLPFNLYILLYPKPPNTTIYTMILYTSSRTRSSYICIIISYV